MTTLQSPAATSSSPDKPWRTQRPGRLLFLSSCPEPWGGSEELWAGAARRLVLAGHSVSVCKTLVESDHPRIVELRAAGIAVQDYDDYRVSGRKHYINRVLPYRFQFLPESKPDMRRAVCIEQLGRGRFEMAVISQGENFDGLNFVEICRQIGLPYVLICQKASDLNWPPDVIRTTLQRAYADARQIYFVSEHNRLLTQQQVGQELAHSEVVRNPFLTHVPAALDWPPPVDGRFRLACVGRLFVAEKGQDMLMRVLATDRWRQRDLELNLYGKGVHREALESMAQQLALTKVRFRGFTGDITDIWREHHALVLPSRAEGLPLVLVEAMLCGRIGIVTRVGGNAEVVDDGETGFVARGMDDASLDEVLERAWNLRDQWEAMGRKAAERIRERVPADPCGLFATKLEAVFQRTRGGHAA
jgi:glycosyltransferase involved in cell wall biosynthesis